VRGGFYKVRNDPDLVTSKLAALHYYQLSLQAPKPPGGSSTPPRRNVERRSSRARANARNAICRRSKPMLATTHTRRPRCASTLLQVMLLGREAVEPSSRQSKVGCSASELAIR
jgi:hypothetical protein